MKSTEQFEKTFWDAIVVGTGIGGATIGYALAKKGWKVLFLEKGSADFLKATAPAVGDYAEHFKDEWSEFSELLIQAGRYAEPIRDSSSDRPYDFTPLIGQGAGGSSSLYGMVMERFFPEDFDITPFFGDTTEEDLPLKWPISYQELMPYYKKAEALYRVRGQKDPLRKDQLEELTAPPSLSPPNQEIFQTLTKRGLHPYHMPMACDYKPGCKECLGFVCVHRCKNDSAKICLEPALQEEGATLLSNCEVLSLLPKGDQVEEVLVSWLSRLIHLKAKTVILAAGALNTPAILLNSYNGKNNKGLANSSGLVGKNLMRHFMDIYCLQTKNEIFPHTLTKQLALNDLYIREQSKLGTVQAVGRLHESAALVDELSQELQRKGHPLTSQLVKWFKPNLKQWLNKSVNSRMVFTGIMEDLPNSRNRVLTVSGSNRIAIHYKMSPLDRKRLKEFRSGVKNIFQPWTVTFLKNGENNERLAHVCGTCRFGDDPKTSVLDPNNRSHDLKNLYVVDTSFFPTSSGINPSLTVAANALRVAEFLKKS